MPGQATDERSRPPEPLFHFLRNRCSTSSGFRVPLRREFGNAEGMTFKWKRGRIVLRPRLPILAPLDANQPSRAVRPGCVDAGLVADVGIARRLDRHARCAAPARGPAAGEAPHRLRGPVEISRRCSLDRAPASGLPDRGRFSGRNCRDGSRVTESAYRWAACQWPAGRSPAGRPWTLAKPAILCTSLDPRAPAPTPSGHGAGRVR